METEQDYKVAKRELRNIIESLSFSASIVPAAGSDTSEKGQQRFSFSLFESTNNIQGEWFCGSAVALHAFLNEPFRVDGFRATKDWIRAAKIQTFGRGLCVDDAVIRRQIREAYRPSLFDIVSSLLSDASCILSYSDWAEWAQDMGMLDGKAENVRRAQADFATIQQRTTVLRRMFGGDYDKAQECAGRL